MNENTKSFLASSAMQKSLVVLTIVLSLFVLAKVFSTIKSYKYIGTGAVSTNTITVGGTADVSAPADTAEVNFSVSEKAKTATEAQTMATKKMNAIIDYLKKAGFDDKDVKTESYSVYPNYDYLSAVCPANESIDSMSYCPPGKSVLSGYTAEHFVNIRTKKLDVIGDVLTKLGTLGASNISGINLTVEDEKVLTDEARQQAIADARKQAEILAKDLGVKIVRVVSFSDSGNYPPYPYSPYSAKMDAAGGMMSAAPSNSPTIPVGQNKITSNVSIVYEIR